MKTFEKYIAENYNVKLPHGTIPATWFSENGFPMVVKCTCCEMTMASPSALIDDNGYTYCVNCAEEWDNED